MRVLERYAIDVPIDLISAGHRTAAIGEDISLGGMFVRTDVPTRPGSPVGVVMTVEGRSLTSVAWVSHVLAPSDASELGRDPGFGVMFADPQDPRDELFAVGVRQMIRGRQVLASRYAPLRAAVVIGAQRLRERFEYVLAGANVGAVDLRARPDVIVASACDVAMVRAQIRGATPIVAVGDRGELENAFAAGAHDVLITPCSTNHAIARIRNAARFVEPAPRQPEALLTGQLASFPLTSILTMLEHDHATCRVLVYPPSDANPTAEGSLEWHVREYTQQAFRIDLVTGRIVAASGGDHALWRALDCVDGRFEIVALAAQPAVPGLSVTQVVLEHARQCDELRRVTKGA